MIRVVNIIRKVSPSFESAQFIHCFVNLANRVLGICAEFCCVTGRCTEIYEENK